MGWYPTNVWLVSCTLEYILHKISNDSTYLEMQIEEHLIFPLPWASPKQYSPIVPLIHQLIIKYLHHVATYFDKQS